MGKPRVQYGHQVRNTEHPRNKCKPTCTHLKTTEDIYFGQRTPPHDTLSRTHYLAQTNIYCTSQKADKKHIRPG